MASPPPPESRALPDSSPLRRCKPLRPTGLQCRPERFAASQPLRPTLSGGVISSVSSGVRPGFYGPGRRSQFRRADQLSKSLCRIERPRDARTAMGGSGCALHRSGSRTGSASFRALDSGSPALLDARVRGSGWWLSKTKEALTCFVR